MRRLPHLALTLLLVLAASAWTAAPGGAKDDEGAIRADEIFDRWQAGVKHTDFGSFSKRMASIRALGEVPSPRARKHLLVIARTAKAIDDRIVAISTLGPDLSVAEAEILADVVARRRDPLLSQALARAYILATGDPVHVWLATTALEAKEPLVLQAALDAQSIHADARSRERLHAIYTKHVDRSRGIELAHGALRALGAIADPRDRTFLLRVGAHPDWRIRLAGAETIARQKPVDVNIRGAVVSYLHDESPVVREAAAESAANARIVELTDHLADLLEDEHIRTRDVAHAALVALHERDLGWDPSDWKRWWKTRAGAPQGIKLSPSSSVTSYYGLKVHSDRILFIVDLSGSMAFPWGAEIEKTRIGVARRELARAIRSLEKTTLFNIVVFSDSVKAWRAKGEVHATDEGKREALAWVDRVFAKPEGGTFMHAALETAFEHNPQVDTIFLLTDGLATDGEPIVPEAILASVNRWNRFRRVVIHTFALTLEELDPDGLRAENLAAIKRFMRRLAALTGGESRIITKPPETPK